MNFIKVDNGAEGGFQKWMKNIVNNININFSIVDKGLGEGGGGGVGDKTLIPFFWIKCRFFRDPSLNEYQRCL